MPHGHYVDNCSLRFRGKGRHFEHGQSRSPTQIFKRNLLPASHRLWVYVCAFGLELMEMMAMAMAMAMVIVMVLVIVIIVPEVLRQVGWLRQHQHQSFHWPRAFHSQSFHKLRVFHRPKASRGKLYSSRICSWMLDPETCWVADARHREAWGRWCVAGGRWWVAGGGRPKSWPRSIS